MKRLGDNPATRAMRAGYSVNRRGKEAAKELRELAENTDGFSEKQLPGLWLTLAQLSYRVRDNKQAEKLCRRIMKVEPDSLRTQNLLFQIAIQKRDVVAMETILDEIKRIQKTPDAFWHYGEAIRLLGLANNGASEKLLERARQAVEKAIALRPNWGQARLLAGIVHERQYDEQQALQYYTEAIQRGVNAPNAIRHAAQLLSKTGRFREADRMFRRLGETKDALPDDAEREMRLVKARLGEYEEAVKLAREVAAESDKFRDHVWLGQLLGVVGRQAQQREEAELAKKSLAEAEQALQHAVEIQPDAPEAWVALIQFHGQADQLAKAEKTIAQAKKSLSPTQAASALAQCYEALSMPDKAAEHYKAAVRLSPKDALVARRAATFYFRNNRDTEGEEQLQRIIEGEVDATDAQRAWARRMLGSMLFARGDADQQKKRLETGRSEPPQQSLFLGGSVYQGGDAGHRSQRQPSPRSHRGDRDVSRQPKRRRAGNPVHLGKTLSGGE